MFKSYFIDITITAHRYIDPAGQGVDHRNTYAVQTTGELVVFIGELATSVQTAEDQFNTRHAFLRVDIHRHTTAVVYDFQRLVFVQNHMH